MRSAQLLTVFAVLAASVSSMSIGHTSNQLVHRRRAGSVTHDSVLQARGARKAPMSDVIERSETAPRRVRKRGINQRRCVAKSQPSLTPALASTSASSTTPEPKPTTTSHETTSSSKAKYTKTTTKATKTSSPAQATPTSDSGSSSGSSFTGEGTYYATGLGACGITNVDTDYICAVSQLLFDGFDGYTGSDPNSNPICGKKLTATYQGKSVTVTVTDRCVGCAYADVDFSPSAFDQIADRSVGRLTGLTWKWV